MSDTKIINNFGEERLKMSLFSVFCLIGEQSRGEKGFLSVSGCNNVFYVRGIVGDILPISVYWDWVPSNEANEGWAIGALECSDEDDDNWSEGDRLCLPC